MEYVLHKSESRGYADHGWLKSFHSFSFANYFNPEKTHFGLLRVLNDDFVTGGKGFGMHPHQNMEIISIPLEGELEHEDSTGTKRTIQTGDIQVMSAGTGIYHSEYNKSSDKPVRFLQIWIFPKLKDINPRYDQRTLEYSREPNSIQTIVAPMETSEDVIKINQDAYISIAKIEKDNSVTYKTHKRSNGVYTFALEGNVLAHNQVLNRRDALGVWNTESFEIDAKQESNILFIEVPMAYETNGD